VGPSLVAGTGRIFRSLRPSSAAVDISGSGVGQAWPGILHPQASVPFRALSYFSDLPAVCTVGWRPTGRGFGGAGPCPAGARPSRRIVGTSHRPMGGKEHG